MNIPLRNTTVVRILASLFLVTVAITGLQPDLEHLYFPSPYHRLQVQALLHGQLHLETGVQFLSHDLAYWNGRVQQVWGLGVPLLMLPFAVVWSAFSRSPLPDLVPFLTAVGCLGWYQAATAQTIGAALKSRWAGILVLYAAMLASPVWSLLFGHRQIYEMTSLYSQLVTSGMLMATLNYLVGRRMSEFVVVITFTALAAHVRPTHLVYALLSAAVSLISAMLPASQVAFRSSHRISPGTSPGRKERHVGATAANALWRIARQPLVVAGLILGMGVTSLLWSNWIRFGSPMEFGHSLTISSDVIVYPTRFRNDCAEEHTSPLARELFSWIFLSPLHDVQRRWTSPDVVPLQAPCPRWRDAYMRTFDPSAALVWILTAIAGTTCTLRSPALRVMFSGSTPSRPKTGHSESEVNDPVAGEAATTRMTDILTICTAAWSAFSFVGLSLFYLRFPTISSRYILDYGPSLLAATICIIVGCPKRFRFLVYPLILAWTIAEALISLRPLHDYTIGMPQTLMPQDAVESKLKPASGRAVEEFAGLYDWQHHPSLSGIRYNGLGWGSDGKAKSILLVMVDRPSYFELNWERTAGDTDLAPLVRIGHSFLLCDSLGLGTIPGSMTARYLIPGEIAAQNCDQVVSICFRLSFRENDLMSLRKLNYVRWR